MNRATGQRNRQWRLGRPADMPGQPLAGDEEPPLGAHLVTPRRGYRHHGIYVGNGQVVHYGGLSRALRGGPVEEVPLARFADGRGIYVKPVPCARFDSLEVIRRARSRLGEDRYRLLTNNCEHFCEWCLSATPHSEQVERWLAPRAVLPMAARVLQRWAAPPADGVAWAV